MLNEISDQLQIAEIRAERWKEMCRNLCVGMPSVFQSYELAIEGKAKPLIDSAGMYRCCIEKINGLDDVPDGSQSVCRCGTIARLKNNTWRAS